MSRVSYHYHSLEPPRRTLHRLVAALSEQRLQRATGFRAAYNTTRSIFSCFNTC
ncbi:hypothetical protein LY78DRAFT_652547 [Colletotrichum sublineola]|nr:hypothetical protein LY78DRAFT_652547 [Colletotrichum sublineola]